MLFVIWGFQMKLNMLLTEYCCSSFVNLLLLLYVYIQWWLKTQQCPNVFFFHSIRVYLEYMWRKWLQSVWKHEFFVQRINVGPQMEKEPSFLSAIIGICHNFLHYFSSSQGILEVLIGLVLFFICSFLFGGFFFLLPSYCIFAPF